MKSAVLPNDFPNDPAAWEKLIANAPGEDRPPTPEEEALRKNAVLAHSLPELREKLSKGRGPDRRPLKVQRQCVLTPTYWRLLKPQGAAGKHA